MNRFAALLAAAGFATAAQAALADKPDAAAAAKLHEQKCVGCHVGNFGGDGSSVYTRKNRIVKDMAGLRQRVALCSSQSGAGLLDDEELAVAAYLNQQYYKFK